MNEVLYLICRVAISVVCAVIGLYLIPFLKTQVKDKQQSEILKIVEVAVQAAEQTLKSGAIKKADVLNFMQGWLTEHGIDISEEQLDRLIESAVYQMNLYKIPSGEIEVE